MPKVQRRPKIRSQPDENARNLHMLALFLDEAPGFRLGFATYDLPEDRERYLTHLAEFVVDRPVHLTRLDLVHSPHEELLLDRLQDHLRDNPPPEGKKSAVMVIGLEASIDFHTRPPLNTFRGGPLLLNANLQRDAYLRLCPVPIVIWLNNWGYAAFAQAAPDLWHWRAGTFSFSGSPDTRRNLPTQSIITPLVEIEAQPRSQKRERIAMLRDLAAELENADDRDTAGNQARRAALLLQIGLVHGRLSEMPEAIGHYNRALELYRAAGDLRGEAYSLLNLGIAYRQIGQPEKAIPLHDTALAMSRRLGDKRFEEIFLNELGNANQSLGQTERALACFEQARMIAQEIGDRHGEADALTNMGNAHRYLGQLEQSIRCKEEALAIARELGNRGLEAHALGGLGAIYSGTGQIEKGLDALDQALSIARELGDRQTEGYALANVGTTYSMLGSPDKATDFLTQSLQTAEAIEDPVLTKFASAHLARLANNQVRSQRQ
jgi:tetratricopeptide (TPR) repeat protein